MSIITPEAAARCAEDAARKDHLNALRAIELARASKRINDHYDKLLLGELPTQLSRRVFDRRTNDLAWGGRTNFLPLRPAGFPICLTWACTCQRSQTESKAADVK